MLLISCQQPAHAVACDEYELMTRADLEEVQKTESIVTTFLPRYASNLLSTLHQLHQQDHASHSF